MSILNKITPGPWEWSDRSLSGRTPSKDSRIPFSIHKNMWPQVSAVSPVADIVNFPPATEEQTALQRANAILIAAAPDMLSIIERLATVDDNKDDEELVSVFWALRNEAIKLLNQLNNNV